MEKKSRWGLWYAKNQDHRKEYMKEWRKNNSEKVKQYKKRYRDKSKEVAIIE